MTVLCLSLLPGTSVNTDLQKISRNIISYFQWYSILINKATPPPVLPSDLILENLVKSAKFRNCSLVIFSHVSDTAIVSKVKFQDSKQISRSVILLVKL